MNKILILTSDLNLKALVNLIIQYNFSIEIVNHKSTAIAVDYIRKSDETLKCIIADESFPSGGATKLYKETQAAEHSIPVIALHEPHATVFDSKDNFFARVPKDNIAEKLIDVVDDITKKEKPEVYLKENHLPMNLDLLLDLNTIGKDSFIRLNENKYIKILNKNDYFSNEDYTKYKSKGVNKFYVKADDVDEILGELSSNLKTMLDLSIFSKPESLSKIRNKFDEEEDKAVLDMMINTMKDAEAKKMTFDEVEKASTSGLDLVRKTNSKFGNGNEVQTIAKATVLLTMSTIKQSPKLNELFDKATSSADTYLNDHCFLLSNVCCQIANLLGWTSRLTHYKLTMAAMLHDITLPTSKLARYRGLPDLMLDASQFKDEEIKAFMTHPEEGAKLVSEFRMIPGDTDTIILQHHERPDGKGFPQKINFSKLTPLTCVFIVAHDLVSFIMSDKKGSGEKQNWNMVSFLNQHRLLYQNGVFKDIFNVMWRQMVHTNK